jgi:protein-S-isoprenylcysteine O-methyltransferase Ste14
MSIPPSIAAVVIAVCVAGFFAVNIGNVIWGSKKRHGIEHRAEVSPPSDKEGLMLAGVSTFLLFIFCGLYIILGLFSLGNLFPIGLLQIPQPWVVRGSGLIFFAGGSALFMWSVLARGRYSVSWSMPVDQKLVTWGPYRYVRHPSYTGYFLMFIGLFLVWFNLLAAIPLVGIPGYVMISRREEEMLVLRFGNDYSEYQRKTGRFLPKL